MIALARSGGLLLVLFMMALTANAKTATEVFEIAARSTVVVLTYDGKGEVKAFGSGVVLPGGIIATNCHVIKDAARLAVRYQKQEYPAAMRHTDWERDTCSLTAEGLKAPPVKIGSTKSLKVGTRVFAVGAPKGLELSLSEGIVSSLREIEGGQYIQTTAPISPGSSGGGLFDEDGKLLGLTTFYLADGQNLNFAVPVEWIGEMQARHVADTKWPDWNEIADIVWFDGAERLQVRGQWEELLSHSRGWVEAMPASSLAWFYLGLAYGKVGQHPKAIDAYRQSLRIDPEDATVWYNLGFTYGELGRQYTQAIEAFQQSLRIDPENAAAWFHLGAAFGNLRQYTQAIDAFRNAIRIEPEHPITWYNLGVAYHKTGQTSKVTEVYRRLQQLDPEMAERFFDRAIMP